VFLNNHRDVSNVWKLMMEEGRDLRNPSVGQVANGLASDHDLCTTRLKWSLEWFASTNLLNFHYHRTWISIRVQITIAHQYRIHCAPTTPERRLVVIKAGRSNLQPRVLPGLSYQVIRAINITLIDSQVTSGILAIRHEKSPTFICLAAKRPIIAHCTTTGQYTHDTQAGIILLATRNLILATTFKKESNKGRVSHVSEACRRVKVGWFWAENLSEIWLLQDEVCLWPWKTWKRTKIVGARDWKG
jgi:hypothetical protein